MRNLKHIWVSVNLLLGENSLQFTIVSEPHAPGPDFKSGAAGESVCSLHNITALQDGAV